MRFTFLFFYLTVFSVSVYSQKNKIQGPYLSINIDTLSYGKIKINTDGERSLEIKNIGIHRSFQVPQIFDSLSVLENVMISNLVATNKQYSFSKIAK